MISILLPTRKRPENIVRLHKSALETADDPSQLEFIIAIDDDDTSYDQLMEDGLGNTLFFKVPRQVLSKYWNDCYQKSTGDILMHCGDDIIFRTPKWDKIVTDKFAEYPDHIVFVYGNDGSGVHDGKFGTHGFIHRKWAETVGYFVPPYFSSDYNDTWLNDVAKMIGRHKHVDILTEHMHPDLGKATYDITHQERLKRHREDKVDTLYWSKLKERQADAEKLKGVMQ